MPSSVSRRSNQIQEIFASGVRERASPRDRRPARLADTEVVLSDDILGLIDAVVPVGTDIGQLQMAYNPPAVVKPAMRRRPIGEHTAA